MARLMALPKTSIVHKIMEYANTHVFAEITICNQPFFLWYKLADNPTIDDYIIPDRILSPQEHWDALQID